MTPRHHPYVGPSDIRETALAHSPPGAVIHTIADLANWIDQDASNKAPDGSLVATFVVGVDGTLALAPRHSEHVACSGGVPVLSAGEMTFTADLDVVEVTNQSTGFCPEPTSWPTVASALDEIEVTHPGRFTVEIVFRRCPRCSETNIVKDNWYVCALCEADLPTAWNYLDEC